MDSAITIISSYQNQYEYCKTYEGLHGLLLLLESKLKLSEDSTLFILAIKLGMFAWLELGRLEPAWVATSSGQVWAWQEGKRGLWERVVKAHAVR